MVNQENFDTFWYWINERYAILQKKNAGEPKPWSDDPIFQEWKFCNVFRTDDKQTQFYLNNVVEPHEDDDPGLIIFNAYAFRAFNLYSTYDVMGGWFNHWSPTLAKQRIQNYSVYGKSIMSGAYMIRGREGMPKYESIILTLDAVWESRNELASALSNNTGIQNAFDVLMNMGFWGWADFTTYQVVLDLTYTKILRGAQDLNEWCTFGPGAKRGLELIYPGIKPSNYLTGTKELYLLQDEHRGSHVPQLSLQDIEFSLCETSKYVRILNGGHGKQKYPGK